MGTSTIGGWPNLKSHCVSYGWHFTKLGALCPIFHFCSQGQSQRC